MQLVQTSWLHNTHAIRPNNTHQNTHPVCSSHHQMPRHANETTWNNTQSTNNLRTRYHVVTCCWCARQLAKETNPGLHACMACMGGVGPTGRSLRCPQMQLTGLACQCRTKAHHMQAHQICCSTYSRIPPPAVNQPVAVLCCTMSCRPYTASRDMSRQSKKNKQTHA